MKKVICVYEFIANEFGSMVYGNVTKGKWYDVYDILGSSSMCYMIRNNYGVLWEFPKECFNTINEYRNNQINKIL